MGIIGIQWFLFGFSLAYSPGGPFIGSFEWAALSGWGVGAIPAARTIPGLVFAGFQVRVSKSHVIARLSSTKRL